MYKDSILGRYEILLTQKDGNKFIVMIGGERKKSDNSGMFLDLLLKNFVDPFLDRVGLVRKSKVGHYNGWNYDSQTGIYRLDDTGKGKIIDETQRWKELTIGYFDINDFKDINKYGHDVGDLALAAFGEFLKALFNRESDLIFRNYHHGDEFVVVTPTKYDNGENVSERYMREGIPKEITLVFEKIKIPFSYSLGVSTGKPNNVEELEKLINEADRLCMREKGEKEKVAILARPIVQFYK